MKRSLLTLMALVAFMAAKSQIITTIAGPGIASGDAGDGGPATAASILGPWVIALDGSGNMFIGEYGNIVRKISSSGIITTYAGNGLCCYVGDGGQATAASFNNGTYGVAVDGSGNVFVSDQGTRIRKINPSGIISTFAGGSAGGFSGDGGVATAAKISSPAGVQVDNTGNVYIVDESNARIRKVNTSSIITTVAGGGLSLGDGGAATSAHLTIPSAVAIDGLGNIYIADKGDARVRKINTAGVITTIAGNGTNGYSGDGGTATTAQLRYPGGLAVDNVGNVYISDVGNNVIRKVNNSGIISTFAGGGISSAYGINGDGGPATDAQFAQPQGIALDISGNVYIADYGHGRIRKISGSVLPISGPSNVCVGSNITLSDGTPGGIWSSSNVSVATVGSSTGTVTGLSPGITMISYGGIVTTSVTVNSLPVAGTIVGPTQVCVGLSIALTNATTGGTWSNTNTHTTISGSIVTGNSPGIDTVQYTVTNTCGNAVATQTLTVNASPAVGTIIGPSNVCIGSSIVLTNSVLGGTWNSTNTAATISSGVVTGNATGIDTIQYTVANAFCIAVTTKTLTINPLPSAHSVTGGGTYCAGGTGVAIGLNNSTLSVNYQLYNGSTTVGGPAIGTGSAITFGLQTAAGTYSVSANNPTTSCSSNMADSASIVINPLPTLYIVSGSGSYSDSAIITLSVSQTGINYQLYATTAVGSPKSGTGASLSFTVTTSGIYFVVATNPATGCTDTMNGSATVSITPTAVNMLTATANITISPNPAHQTLSIEAPTISRIQIYDLVGRCIVDEHYNTDKTVVDIGAFKPGLYLIRVNNHFIQKIIKD